MKKDTHFTEEQLENVKKNNSSKEFIDKVLKSEYQQNRKKRKQQLIEEYYKNPQYCKCGCGQVLHPTTDKGFRVNSYAPGCKQISPTKGKKMSKEAKMKISFANKGNKPWCQGETKETNTGLQRISEYMKKHNPSCNPEINKKMLETKYKNGKLGGGKCKWIQYNGKKIQGNFELKFAKFLDSIGLDWISHKGIESFKYIGLDGKEHWYQPDFKDENGVYYDPHAKYYWDDNFEYKINEVKKLNPDKQFIVFHEDNYLETCQMMIEKVL